MLSAGAAAAAARAASPAAALLLADSLSSWPARSVSVTLVRSLVGVRSMGGSFHFPPPICPSKCIAVVGWAGEASSSSSSSDSSSAKVCTPGSEKRAIRGWAGGAAEVKVEAGAAEVEWAAMESSAIPSKSKSTMARLPSIFCEPVQDKRDG